MVNIIKECIDESLTCDLKNIKDEIQLQHKQKIKYNIEKSKIYLENEKKF